MRAVNNRTSSELKIRAGRILWPAPAECPALRLALQLSTAVAPLVGTALHFCPVGTLPCPDVEMAWFTEQFDLASIYNLLRCQN